MEVTTRIYFATTAQPQLALRLRLMSTFVNHSTARYIIGARVDFTVIIWDSALLKEQHTKLWLIVPNNE